MSVSKLKAAKASMECMNRNDYKKYLCKDFFEAYRDCKKTWVSRFYAMFPCDALHLVEKRALTEQRACGSVRV